MTLIICNAPESCRTPDMCGNLAKCCWPAADQPQVDTRTVMVPMSSEMLARLGDDWSEPVQFRVETDSYGRRSLVLRTVGS